MSKHLLIELQYLPPVQYFASLARAPVVLLEAHEHYQKASYRNRAHIAGANGVLRLSVPLEKGKNEQQPIREVRIAHHERWQALHWESIRSAYGNAPFFLHYADVLAPFYQQKYTWLWDWNFDLLQLLLSACQLQIEVQLSDAYYSTPPPHLLDLRNAIHPKTQRQQPEPAFKPTRYPQVFEEKQGFLPNLSILDLLFCTGPETAPILKTSSEKAF
ncbi:MAG TPA: WbqC family protein [Saprospiraceae bacterium]|nr:WbqC family protein [Saprospiraceae bacterium]HMP24439.1 WbqC family protein [Saprospiraceae bacterium]